MELGKTSYVVLGMLRLGKRTGYEIKQLADVSTRFFWATSYGQIYPELKRLEDAGLIRGEHESQGGRQRRAHELTDAGEAALHDWLTSEDPLHFELRHEGLLKFFFAGSLTPEEQVHQTVMIRREHERVRKQLRAIDPGAPEGVESHPLMTLRFGIAYQDFVVEWCERMERELALAHAAAGS
jgi:PadR family transcriptional regulator AphA